MLSTMSKCYPGYFQKMITEIVKECEKNKLMFDKIKDIILPLSEANDKVLLFIAIGEAISERTAINPAFSSDFVEVLSRILTVETDLYDIRSKLAISESEESKKIFKILYPAL